MSGDERRGLLYAALGVCFFATTPVLIIWADPLPAEVITWGRMLVAAVAVWVASTLAGRGSHSARADRAPAIRERRVVRFLGYGLIAALHFFFYIASLDYTTVAHSLAIVYTAPIFVTLLSARLLREPVRRRQGLGIAISVLGIAIVSGLEPNLTWSIVVGDFLALLSAITFGFYSVAGRYERSHYPLLVYASRVYAAAALWLLPAAAVHLPNLDSDDLGWQQVGSVLALGLGPLALGHTLYNAALRRVHATSVNIIASQEVTGGIILSWLLLGQMPSGNSLVGAAITLLGIALVLR
jgi:drug/metabolite transporter (DMT)-like permease